MKNLKMSEYKADTSNAACDDEYGESLDWIFYPEEIEGVVPNKAVREYIKPETDILFVLPRLPARGAPDEHIFGRGARQVWRTMFAAGLVKNLYDDPLEAEANVFGSGLGACGSRVFSIIELRWSWEAVLPGRRIQFVDWACMEKMFEALHVKKVAFVGRKLASLAAPRTTPKRSTPPYGYLRHRAVNGNSVPLYGLPLVNIGPESVRYVKELNGTGRM